MPVRFVGRYTRRMAQALPDVLFVFGDNMERKGYGGQAKELRGEPNAVGIPTKWAPTMHEGSFFRDEDMPEVKPAIISAFAILEQHVERGGTVIWPSQGIGSGRAKLGEKAPAIADYIRHRLDRLRGLS